MKDEMVERFNVQGSRFKVRLTAVIAILNPEPWNL